VKSETTYGGERKKNKEKRKLLISLSWSLHFDLFILADASEAKEDGIFRMLGEICA